MFSVVFFCLGSGRVSLFHDALGMHPIINWNGPPCLQGRIRSIRTGPGKRTLAPQATAQGMMEWGGGVVAVCPCFI